MTRLTNKEPLILRGIRAYPYQQTQQTDSIPDAIEMLKALYPQALTTSFHQRVKNDQTSLYITTQTTRGTKRTAAVVNYSEDPYEEPEERLSSPTELEPVLRSHPGKLATRTTADIDLAPEKVALQKTNLVPISVNLEHQQARIADFFMWNTEESVITPDKFAQVMCDDLELPVSIQSQISSLISQQLEEHAQLLSVALPDDLQIHVVIDLSVNLDKRLFQDKFEWDLLSQMTPEEFAETVVAEMGLEREFYPAIAHSLHEALLKCKRDALQGRLAPDVVNGAAYGKEAGWRFDPENLGQEWSPKVEVLSQWEIEKREIERERNIRRKKRENLRVDGDRGRRRGTRRYDELDGTWVY